MTEAQRLAEDLAIEAGYDHHFTTIELLREASALLLKQEVEIAKYKKCAEDWMEQLSSFGGPQ